MLNIFLIPFLFFSCSSNLIKNEKIAYINNNEIVIVGSIFIKEKIEKKLFDNQLKFDNVLIKKNSNPDFYYVQFENNENNVKVVRVLLKKGNQLFFNNSSTSSNNFNREFVTCMGDCDPKIIQSENQFYWSCDGTFSCNLPNIIPENNTECKRVAVSIID